ncbi:peptide chain release factor H [Cerasicoccus frondis]|uniref:peptide chain release factor H n=1 Tax=Cerasicoccus frondis TaxID=490090 RepID=UPI002852AB2B|nr:peptide chain release factor H [Cerasicoccus frondis]
MKAWVQITSGRGPEECCLAVAELMRVFEKEVRKAGFAIDLLEAIAARHRGTYLSVLLTVEGKGVRDYLKSWEGTVQWIQPSSYRPNHGRKNWFVGVNVFHPPEEGEKVSTQDIRYEAIRASGPGGQHVNKTSSAIRATHAPTGLTATAQEERSQLMNKKLATARLLQLLANEAQAKQDSLQQKVWHQHNCLERGNPVRVYKGSPMRRVSG